MNILFLDTETTGTDPKRHSIVEVAALFYSEGELKNSYCFHQPPTKSVSLSALRYNSLRIENLVQMQKAQSEMNFGGFVDFLLNLPKDTILVGHNVKFDIDFIKAEAENLHLEDIDQILPRKIIDTKILGNFFQTFGTLKATNTTLTGLAEVLGIKYDSTKLHGAYYDAELTKAVYYGLATLV